MNFNTNPINALLNQNKHIVPIKSLSAIVTTPPPLMNIPPPMIPIIKPSTEIKGKYKNFFFSVFSFLILRINLVRAVTVRLYRKNLGILLSEFPMGNFGATVEVTHVETSIESYILNKIIPNPCFYGRRFHSFKLEFQIEWRVCR